MQIKFYRNGVPEPEVIVVPDDVREIHISPLHIPHAILTINRDHKTTEMEIGDDKETAVTVHINSESIAVFRGKDEGSEHYF